MSLTRAESDATVASSVEQDPPATAASRNRTTRILSLDRSARRSGPASLNPEVRSLIERAVVNATNSWTTAHETEDGARGTAYASLSIIGDAVGRVLSGGTADLRDWPALLAVREPLDRLRRALLEQLVTTRLSTDEALSVLRALERVHEVSQRDTTLHFADALSSGNALDIVVGIAHDMRSPLGSILFLVETLRNAYRGKSTAVEERQLGLVYGAALGLSQLVSDVIELARGCDRLLDRQPVPFSVSELLNSVLRVVQPIAEEKRLAIYAQLPEVDARVGYPAALSRVMLNLVTNALKFTNDGYVEISSRQLSRTRVEFEVRDTGPGIPDEKLTTLYQAVRKGHRSKGQVLSSSGLGLSICQRLVTAMGGELQVETAVGRETRFHFVLELPPATKI
jgi:signal transduction histidine kinase